MLPLIENNRLGLIELCRQYHVKTLEIFGSAADGTFDPARSDLDFLVEFLPDPAAQPFDDFFDLLDSLQTLFGRKVDLIMPRAIRNPYLQQAIDRQRRVLYAA